MRIKTTVLNLWNSYGKTGVLIVIFLYFIGASTFFALKLKPAIVPDEPEHFLLSKQFATSWGIPKDTPETEAFVYISHKPFLYYWINGRVLNTLTLIIPNITEWRMLVSLRLLSVIYSIFTILFCYLLSKEILENRWHQLLVVFLLTNTLMFVFLSGGTTYDNLTNLCSFAGIYFLVRLFKGNSFFGNSLGWLIFIFAGGLVKITVLPLACITGLSWILYILKNRRQLNFKPIWDWKVIIGLIILATFVGLNLAIYGFNIIKYRALTPPCVQVLTQEQCNLSVYLARAQQMHFLANKLNLRDIVNGAGPDPARYVLDYWVTTMLQRIIGILGHKSYLPNQIITYYRLLLIWTILMVARYAKRPSYAIGSLILIFLFYLGVLIWTNYGSELSTGFQHIAIQGRYLFPVIGIIYVLMVFYLGNIPNILLRRLSFASTLLLFILGCPVLFLTHYSSVFASWFN